MSEYSEAGAPDRRWRVVGAGRCDEGDRAGQSIVILQQSADLPLRVVSAEALGDPQQYLPVADVVPRSDDALRETLANIRQHGTLRFAAIPLFIAIFGALAAKYYSAPAVEGLSEAGRALLPWLGMGAALWFGMVEAFLSRNLLLWWLALRTQSGRDDWRIVWAHRFEPEWMVDVLRVLLFVPYAAAFGFWVWQLAPFTANRAHAMVHGGAAALALNLAAILLWTVALRGRAKKGITVMFLTWVVMGLGVAALLAGVFDTHAGLGGCWALDRGAVCP